MEAIKKPYLFHALIILAGLAIWSGAFFAPYQFDDYVTPLQDPASQSLFAFFENFFKTLRPLSKFTYAVESSLGLTEAYQRRILQFLLISISSLLMFELLRKRSQNLWFVTALTLIWVAHPMHSETFISLAGRPTLLAICFILASLWEERVVLSLFYALLAVLSKEVAIPFFLYQSYRLARSQRKHFLYLLIPLVLVTIGLFRERLWKLIQFSWNEVPYYIHWWDGVAAFSAELLYLVMPWRVNVDPDFLFLPSSLWFFISILLIMGLIYWGKKTSNALTKKDLVVWFLLAIPMHSIILKLDPLALRSLSFVSLIFPCLVLNTLRPSVALVLLLPIVAYSTFNLSRTYQDPISLWTHARENSPNKVRPVVNLSYFLVRQDRLNEAKLVIQSGLEKWPHRIILQERLEAVETLIDHEQIMKQGN